MPFYIKRGSIPSKRHIQHKSAEGKLRYEEHISREGFSDIYSNVYHLLPPTRVKKIDKFIPVELQPTKDQTHRHHHLETFKLDPNVYTPDIVFAKPFASRKTSPEPRARLYMRTSSIEPSN